MPSVTIDTNLPPAVCDSSELPQRLQAFLADRGLAAPTAVQRRCWPACLLGRDLICIAPTGSGKTLGYVLPFLERMRQLPPPTAGRPVAMVLVPTRELAQQVAAACEPMHRLFGVRIEAVHGGTNRGRQLALLWEPTPPTALVVATPGRLMDLAQVLEGSGGPQDKDEAALDLSRVQYVVVDEADKMMQMGLLQQVESLWRLTAAARQTLLFSATFPSTMHAVAATMQRRPLTLRVGAASALDGTSGGGGGGGGEGGGEGDDEEGEEAACVVEAGSWRELAIPPQVTQHVWVAAEHKKPRKLLRLLEKLGHASSGGSAGGSAGGGGGGAAAAERRVLIFANKIKTASFVEQLLARHRVSAALLTSQLSQRAREAVLRRFAASEVEVLVATDVAARGLHIDDLRHVVCWDLGTNLPQYVHRIGRTGRQGRPGTAYAFFTRNLLPLAADLLQLLRAHGQQIDPYLQQLVAETASGAVTGSGGGGGGGGASSETVGTAKDEEGEEAGEGKKRRQAATAEAGEVEEEEDDDDDDDSGGGGAPLWLAAKLASPITGGLGTFSSNGLAARAAAGEEADSDDEGQDEDEQPMPKKAKKKKKKKKLKQQRTE